VEAIHHVINATEVHIVALGIPKGLIRGVLAILFVLDVLMLGKLGFINYVVILGKDVADVVVKGGWTVAVVVVAYFYASSVKK
jgi:hypothetical protein